MTRLFIISAILFVGQAYSKSYEIDLDKLMQTSKFRAEVIILDYQLNSDSSVKSIKVAPVSKPDSVFYITKVKPDDYWGHQIKYSAKPRPKKFKHWEVAVYWPNINEKVLVILDSTGALTLFGEINGGNYRLFADYFTGSATIIYSNYFFSSPRKPLKTETGYVYITTVYITKKDLKTKWTSKN